MWAESFLRVVDASGIILKRICTLFLLPLHFYFCSSEVLVYPTHQKIKDGSQGYGVLRIELDNRSEVNYEEIKIQKLCLFLKGQGSMDECGNEDFLNGQMLNGNTSFEIRLPTGVYEGKLKATGGKFVESVGIGGVFQNSANAKGLNTNCKVETDLFEKFICEGLTIRSNYPTLLRIIITNRRDSHWAVSIGLAIFTIGIIIIPPSVRHADIEIVYPK